MRTRLFAAMALVAAIAYSQEGPVQPSQSGTTATTDSTATSNSTYEGPSILSRDRSLIGERGGKLLDYTFWGAVSGVYDSSFIPVSVNSSGQIPINDGIGVEASWGLTGSRTWRHDRLSVEYSGAVFHYPNNSYFDGFNEFLNLSYFHRFSRRLAIQTRETAGSTFNSTGYYNYLPLQNTDLYAVPTNQLFDDRTDFVQARVDLTWMMSPRLSVNFGGEGFFQRYQSASLASVKGYNGHGDISYRLTHRQTVTVAAEYTGFNYIRQFGNANITTVTAGWSIGLGRRYDFALQGGVGRMDFTGLTLVNLDPAIAAIVGQNSAVVTFHQTALIPIYGAQLTRRFERSAITASYNESYSPGNGVYLASRAASASLGYSYVGFRRLSVSANMGYSRLGSLGQTLPPFTGYYGGVGGTYKLAGYTFLSARVDYRHYDTGSAGYIQNSYRVSVGLAFSPAQRPLPIW